MVLAVAALLWAYAILLTGGFILDVGFLRVSSRSERNPLIGALLAAVAVWVLTPAGRRREVWLGDYFHLAQPVVRLTDAVAKRSRLVGGALAGVLAAATVALGILLGAHVAGGADSYAYLSQARLWAAGTLRVEQPLITDLPPGVPAEALAPLGYRVSPDRASLVPMFPPGLPMLMAVFERTGGATAAFYVMPLLAGLCVYVTYAFGTMLAGPLAGLLAALLIATSPAFVFQVTHAPMSDIAAAGWWGSALLLLPRVSRSSALVAGLATGAAILTRPNLVPLALIPGGLLLWELRAEGPGRRVAVQRLLLFAAASIPACLVIALLNRFWYGSPLQSGYGPLAGSFFQWDHGWPNLQHYWRWAIDSQTPLIVVALAAPVLAWRHLSASTGRPMLVVLVSFVLGVYACYAFYLPFDDWWFLRFLLPAFPASFALMSVALVRLGGRLPGPVRWMAPVLVVGFAVSQSVRFGWANSAYYSVPEWRFAAVGQHIAARLPERAIFVANLHSGSARYYSGRMTIQYDNVPAERLDALLAHVERAGYSVFILVDDAEAPDFIASFSGRSAVGALDWPPVADVSGVKIYETAARAR
jgi:hypothetical protein